MLEIAICDDEKRYREQLHDILLKVLFANEEPSFTYYRTGEEVIDAIEEKRFGGNMIFLDINMPGVDGLAVAKYIRDNRVDTDIFFATVSKEHVFDGYRYHAYSYLVKPFAAGRIAEEMNRYLKELSETSECLHVNINNRQEKISLDRVFYFEGEGRKIRCHQRNGEQAFYAKMGELEQVLQEHGFIRCHQSYLVNQKYIENVYRTELKVAGVMLPVSRKYGENMAAWGQKADQGGIYIAGNE